jgi:predicted dehydrogenase
MAAPPDPIRIGVVGCGAIAQIQHLPNLKALRDLFEVTVVCDCSPALAASVARRFDVPRAVTEVRHLLEAEVDAVLLCHTDPKTEAAVAAFAAGKHVLIEKPLCFSNEEAARIAAAARRAGTVGIVGYMKIYDPAFEVARAEAERIGGLRFVQVNHLHPDNALHLAQFDLTRFDDVPEEARAGARAARAAALAEALGEVAPATAHAFFTLAGSMIHDLYGLRALLGPPSAVRSAEIWNDGRALSFVLEYASGARCVASWIDLPALWDFRETLELYGDDRRVLLSYPTGFARGILSRVVIQEIAPGGVTQTREPALPWESAFVRELRHFHDCITRGAAPRTPVEEARADVALIIAIIRAYQSRAAVPFEPPLMK